MIPEAYTNGHGMNLSRVTFSYSICVIDTEWQECLCLPACNTYCSGTDFSTQQMKQSIQDYAMIATP